MDELWTTEEFDLNSWTFHPCTLYDYSTRAAHGSKLNILADCVSGNQSCPNGCPKRELLVHSRCLFLCFFYKVVPIKLQLLRGANCFYLIYIYIYMSRRTSYIFSTIQYHWKVWKIDAFKPWCNYTKQVWDVIYQVMCPGCTSAWHDPYKWNIRLPFIHSFYVLHKNLKQLLAICLRCDYSIASIF